MPYSHPEYPRGAFSPLRSIPRRRQQSHVFHFNDQDDDSPEDNPPRSPQPDSVPFPRTSPRTSPLPSPVSRSSSHPVLHNGKPLKSSLKFSSSAPAISESPRPMHLRARSAPSTPDANLHPKNVHFAEKDGLATVRVFNRSGRPASLSRPPSADDTETETETESTGRYILGFPFPRTPSPPPLFEIDTTTEGATSLIPAPDSSPYANIHLESLALPPSLSEKQPPSLVGTLVVRNVTYEKYVAVRFTLDDWQTTSEVCARHITTVLPLDLPSRTLGDAAGVIASKDMWDRFAFTIKLEDYAQKLHERVLWLVARFSTGFGGAEWWDNNNGKNYRVGFKPVIPPSFSRRPLTVSAPRTPVLSLIPPPPLTCCVAHLGTSYSEPREKLPGPPCPSPTTSRRLSKLNLLNYAAPSSPPPLSPSLSHSSSSVTPLTSPVEDNATSSLYSLLDSRSNCHSSPTNSRQPTIIGGQPVSFVSPDSTHMDHSRNPNRNGYWSPPRSFAGFGKISLHWPWGSPSGIELGPDESEVIADFRRDADVDVEVRRTRAGSGTSSSTVSSDEAPTPPRRQDSPTNAGIDISVRKEGDMEGGLDADLVYKALVQQWCFAEGSPPAPAPSLTAS
jgi:hypothetical protein